MNDANQRWCERLPSYRPPTETICTREYDVAEIFDDSTPRAFVVQHHYSGSYPAARFRIGLYRRGNLCGVAVFSVPCHPAVLNNVFSESAQSTTELGRFVLLDSVPGNGETWFLARCFDVLRPKGIVGVLSFSDPLPRCTSSGAVVHVGHIGTIYQAHNGIYLGRGTSRTLHLLPDGRVFSDRAAQKIRKGERGWIYAAGQLEAFGAAPVPSDPSERRDWLTNSLRRIARTIRHRGNHKYAWPLSREIRSRLPTGFAYPKQLDGSL